MPVRDVRQVGALPQELTSFIGRRRELAEVRRCLSAARLVTLTGPAGVGKTRLALRAAAESQRGFPDGVVLVELSALADAVVLGPTVTAAFGLREVAGAPPQQTLIDFVRSRSVLLVLDNCEHLIDGCAELADRLLRECPELRILTTSREPLNITGEATLPVAPLSTPDPQRPPPVTGLDRYEAVALFVARAGSAVAGFALTEENHRAVAAICHRLDGLPLAIELAAARLRVLAPDQILNRLTDRFQLLTSGFRTAPSRQQTLRACIDWSYRLCTPAERTLWTRLAVFAGGFELDAVEDVCAGDDLPADHIWDVVSALVDKSIVLAEGQDSVGRYRLLEAIREFGYEALREAGDDARLHRRRRDWVERLVLEAKSDLIGPRMVDWWARLDRELPDIRAALEFSCNEPGEAEHALQIALALHAFWMREHLAEGRQWLLRALSRQTGKPTPQWVRATYEAGLLSCFLGDTPGALTFAEQARELAEQLGDERSRAFAVHTEGNAAIFSGDLPGAVERLEQVLDLHRAAGDLALVLETLIGLSVTSGLLGDHARVIACHEEILAITEPRGELRYRSYALYGLGVALWQQGTPDRAAELLKESLRLKLRVKDALSAGFTLDSLAWVVADTGDHERAAHLLGAAESLNQSTMVPTEGIPNMLEFHERCEQQSRDALGEKRFQAAFLSGSELTFAQAVGYALGEKPSTAPTPVDEPEPELTPREQQVADLVADGLTNKEIAARLVISHRTAEGHIERILTKLGFGTRVQVAAWVAAHRNNGTGSGRSTPTANPASGR